MTAFLRAELWLIDHSKLVSVPCREKNYRNARFCLWLNCKRLFTQNEPVLEKRYKITIYQSLHVALLIQESAVLTSEGSLSAAMSRVVVIRLKWIKNKGFTASRLLENELSRILASARCRNNKVGGIGSTSQERRAHVSKFGKVSKAEAWFCQIPYIRVKSVTEAELLLAMSCQSWFFEFLLPYYRPEFREREYVFEKMETLAFV